MPPDRVPVTAAERRRLLTLGRGDINIAAMETTIRDILALSGCWVITSLLVTACHRLLFHRRDALSRFEERSEERFDTWLDEWLDAGTVSVAAVILLLQIMGTAGWLDKLPVSLVTLLFSAAVLLKTAPNHPRTVPARPGFGTMPFLIGFVFISLVILQIAWDARWNGPEGWDVFTYHLGFPAEWLSRKALLNPLQSYGDFSPPFYPLNSSLVAAWTMLLSGSDLLAKHVQLVFLIIGLPALYRACRSLGASPRAAALAPLAFGLVPIVLGNTGVAYCDLSLAGAYALALAQVLRVQEQPTMRRSLIAGLAAGIFLGAKYSAVPFSIVLWILWLLLLAGMTGKIRHATAFAAGIAAGGGYTYIRNLIITGNPLFPAEIKVGGRLLLPGWIDPAYLKHLDFHKIDLASMCFGPRSVAELGLHAIVYLAPAVPLGICLALFGLRRNRLKTGLPRFWIMLAPALLFWLYYVSLPYRYHPRFFLPAVAAASVNLAILVAGTGLPAGLTAGIMLLTAMKNDYYFAAAFPLMGAAVLFAFLIRAAMGSTPHQRV
ncbi:hypothetical protein JW905_15115, partial [bacterium]|nr:hypothetical protein [candidate division CSSED10-310 bacterium]